MVSSNFFFSYDGRKWLECFKILFFATSMDASDKSTWRIIAFDASPTLRRPSANAMVASPVPPPAIKARNGDGSFWPPNIVARRRLLFVWRKEYRERDREET